MKIAVLTFSLDRIGGIAKHTLYLSREFAALGHDVTVWAVEYNPELCYPDLAEGLDIRALRRAGSGEHRESDSRTGLRMLNYLRTLRGFQKDQHRLAMSMPQGYDIMNPHGNMISWAAAEYKRRSATPSVWMCNDFVPVGSPRRGGTSTPLQKLKGTAQSALCLPFVRTDRAAVLAIDKITVLSEQVKQEMEQYYGVQPIVVRKGVDVTRFANGTGPSARGRYHIPDGDMLVLTVCSLIPRRRLEDVIDALGILVAEGRPIHYLIVGRTSHSPEYAAFIKARVASRKLEDHVIFAEETSEDELVDCYQSCDAFIWPADERQSWGSACMEAMAAGRPVIVSRANGFSEVLRDGENALLVLPRSPETIADALRRLAADPALGHTLGRNGQQLMQDQFSWRRYAETMLSLFQDAGSGHLSHQTGPSLPHPSISVYPGRAGE